MLRKWNIASAQGGSFGKPAPRVPRGVNRTANRLSLRPDHGDSVGTHTGRSLYVGAMSDMQIVELDEPEPASARAPWRAGSLTIVAAPVLVAALVIALALPRPAVAPVPTPETARLSSLVFTAPPQRVAPTPSVVATPLIAATVESGDAEVLAAQHWTALGPSYPVRGDVAEAVLHGSVYVIGGAGISEDGRHVYRYSVRTGERERVADLPISLDHAMAATLENRIYVLGGFVFGQASARVFSLGANDNDWVEHSLMPLGRAAGGAVVLSGRIWLVGGVGGNGSWITDVWSWDGRGAWSTGLARIPTPRDHLAVAAWRGSICAAGGNGGERNFECYEPVRDEWTRMLDLRTPVIGARAIAAAGWLWVVGINVQVFTLNRWQFGPRLNFARLGHALVDVDDTLYVIEGGMGPTNGRMEMLRPQP